VKRLLLVGVAALAGCAQSAGPLAPEASSARAFHADTVSNVYVLTQNCGTACVRGSTNGLLRFPVRKNTYTPNMSKGLSYTPALLAVSQYNGNLAVVHFKNSNISVYDKNLMKLYDIATPKYGTIPDVVSITYDYAGNLYVGAIWPYGSFSPSVLEYYGSDTTPDKIWQYEVSRSYGDSEPLSLASTNVRGDAGLWWADPSSSELKICSNVSSTSCSATGIPNQSVWSPGGQIGLYLANVALLNRDNTKIAEMWCRMPSFYGQPCIGNGNVLRYYSLSGSKWSLTSTVRVCDAIGQGLSLYSLEADRNGALYYPCTPNSEYYEAAVVEERFADGAKYHISGVGYTVGAGAY
jgi:hypothetical protein